ncbi:hypothetical protein C8Q80DRAFT_1133938 [Daedaleopsis nitida]|nr:hypothetical protein C8Q80DRAFT_1133938 [Daedaleopsis nitida]
MMSREVMTTSHSLSGCRTLLTNRRPCSLPHPPRHLHFELYRVQQSTPSQDDQIPQSPAALYRQDISLLLPGAGPPFTMASHSPPPPQHAQLRPFLMCTG